MTILMGVMTVAIPVTATEPAGLYIESIVIEDAELVSEEIVIGESLLEPGQEYSEPELREAMYRINRLPFIIRSDFSLRRGSVRGRYELVIKIRETKRFFFGADLTARTTYGEELFEWSVFDQVSDLLRGTYGIEDHDMNPGAGDFEDNLVAGARFSVGAHGVAHVAAVTDLEGLEIGYTHYNLFDRPVYASVRYAQSRDREWRWRLLRGRLGGHIHTNHSLHLELDLADRRWDWEWDSGSDDEESVLALGLRWQYDTTDDPLFPTSGRLVSGRLSYAHYEENDVGLIVSGTPPELDIEIVEAETESDMLMAELSAWQHVPFAPRQTVSLGGSVLFGAADVTDTGIGYGKVGRRENRFDATVGVTYALQLGPLPSPTNSLEQRLELSAGMGYRDLSSSDVPVWRLFGPETDATSINLGVSYGLRNRWGVFRFAVVYQDWNGGAR
jgi:hypothetical protein